MDAARKAMDKVRAAVDAAAKIMRMPSELRARFRAEAEERALDEFLDRIDARGAADQDDGDRVGAGEDPAVERPLMPTINPLFGFLIGVLFVLVLISVLALVSS